MIPTDDKSVTHYLIVPLAFLSPENPNYETMKASLIDTVTRTGCIERYALRESTLIQDGLRIHIEGL